MKANADDFWREQVEWLTQQHCLGLNTANAPTKHTQTINHRGMRVGADKRIGERYSLSILFLCHNHRGKVFQVNLVANSRAGRNHAEIAECLLAPAQQGIPLAVALIFALDVPAKREH